MAQQSLVGRGLLIAEVSRLYSDAPHSLGLPWTSDQPVAETLPDNAQHSQETDIHASRALEQCFQPPGRGPVPGPGINYTGPREVLLEFVILVF